MELMKKSAGYAESQIRLLLSDLKNSSHNVKLKALKRFQEYIELYQPELFDDDVDYLYTGSLGGQPGLGLLHWCGIDSDKHDGQLKRIAAPAIALAKWLVTTDVYGESSQNLFYERFVHLSLSELRKINIPKHVLNSPEGSTGSAGQPSQANSQKVIGNSNGRSGSLEDAFTLVSIVMQDHQNMDDEPEPLDVMELFENNKACKERYTIWLQKSKAEHLVRTIEQYKSAARAKAIAKAPRATCWEDVKFQPVPPQEGEEGAVEEKTDGSIDIPILDPLGILDMDLRDTQALYAAGKINVTKTEKINKLQLLTMNMRDRKRGMSNAVAKRDDGFSSNNNGGGDSDGSSSESASDDEDDEDEDDDDNLLVEGSGPLGHPTSGRFSIKSSSKRNSSHALPLLAPTSPKKVKHSVLPRDKNFSGSLFLSLVHGNTDFEGLKNGLNHLKGILDQQGNQRESLVRTHYGLFVQCAEGLDWLKDYKKGVYQHRGSIFDQMSRRDSMSGAEPSKSSSSASSRRTPANGKECLQNGQISLDSAKSKANMTLFPILDRMRKTQRLKSAGKVLKRLTSSLEIPQRMKIALEKEDYREVLGLYQRLLSLSAASVAVSAPVSVPSSASMAANSSSNSGGSSKLLSKVRERADQMIGDLMSQCRRELFRRSNGSVNQLLKWSKLVEEFEGKSSSKLVLHKCFHSQLKFFVVDMKRIWKDFFQKRVQLKQRIEELKSTSIHVEGGEVRSAGLSGGLSSPWNGGTRKRLSSSRLDGSGVTFVDDLSVLKKRSSLGSSVGGISSMKMKRSSLRSDSDAVYDEEEGGGLGEIDIDLETDILGEESNDEFRNEESTTWDSSIADLLDDVTEDLFWNPSELFLPSGVHWSPWDADYNSIHNKNRSQSKTAKKTSRKTPRKRASVEKRGSVKKNVPGKIDHHSLLSSSFLDGWEATNLYGWEMEYCQFLSNRLLSNDTKKNSNFIDSWDCIEETWIRRLHFLQLERVLEVIHYWFPILYSLSIQCDLSRFNSSSSSSSSATSMSSSYFYGSSLHSNLGGKKGVSFGSLASGNSNNNPNNTNSSFQSSPLTLLSQMLPVLGQCIDCLFVGFPQTSSTPLESSGALNGNGNGAMDGLENEDNNWEEGDDDDDEDEDEGGSDDEVDSDDEEGNNSDNIQVKEDRGENSNRKSFSKESSSKIDGKTSIISSFTLSTFFGTLKNVLPPSSTNSLFFQDIVKGDELYRPAMIRRLSESLEDMEKTIVGQGSENVGDSFDSITSTNAPVVSSIRSMQQPSVNGVPSSTLAPLGVSSPMKSMISWSTTTREFGNMNMTRKETMEWNSSHPLWESIIVWRNWSWESDRRISQRLNDLIIFLPRKVDANGVIALSEASPQNVVASPSKTLSFGVNSDDSFSAMEGVSTFQDLYFMKHWGQKNWDLIPNSTVTSYELGLYERQLQSYRCFLGQSLESLDFDLLRKDWVASNIQSSFHRSLNSFLRHLESEMQRWYSCYLGNSGDYDENKTLSRPTESNSNVAKESSTALNLSKGGMEDSSNNSSNPNIQRLQDLLAKLSSSCVPSTFALTYSNSLSSNKFSSFSTNAGSSVTDSNYSSTMSLLDRRPLLLHASLDLLRVFHALRTYFLPEVWKLVETRFPTSSSSVSSSLLKELDLMSNLRGRSGSILSPFTAPNSTAAESTTTGASTSATLSNPSLFNKLFSSSVKDTSVASSAPASGLLSKTTNVSTPLKSNLSSTDLDKKYNESVGKESDLLILLKNYSKLDLDMMGLSGALINDCCQLEDALVNRMLEGLKGEIQRLLYAGYSNILKNGWIPSNGSSHLAQILLLLGSFKTLLRQMLSDLWIHRCHWTSFGNYQKKWNQWKRKINRNTMDGKMNDGSNSSRSKSSSSNTNSSHRNTNNSLKWKKKYGNNYDDESDNDDDEDWKEWNRVDRDPDQEFLMDMDSSLDRIFSSSNGQKGEKYREYLFRLGCLQVWAAMESLEQYFLSGNYQPSQWRFSDGSTLFAPSNGNSISLDSSSGKMKIASSTPLKRTSSLSSMTSSTTTTTTATSTANGFSGSMSGDDSSANRQHLCLLNLQTEMNFFGKIIRQLYPTLITKSFNNMKDSSNRSGISASPSLPFPSEDVLFKNFSTLTVFILR